MLPGSRLACLPASAASRPHLLRRLPSNVLRRRAAAAARSGLAELSPGRRRYLLLRVWEQQVLLLRVLEPVGFPELPTGRPALCPT